MRLFLAALALIVGNVPAEAQWLDRPWPGIPRTADGKPNLTAPAPRGPDGKLEVSLSGGQLIARIIGAAGVDGGEIRPLVPQSETLFEGAGLGYQFIVDDTGAATDLVQINITGPYRFPRQR